MTKNGLEIERKYLLKSLPPQLKGLRGTPVLQGYISTNESREVRLRRHGNEYYITVKDGGGLSRHEIEIAITRRQFDALWPATAGRRLEKTRYVLGYAGHTLELDEYAGDLSPLCVAEVEFESVAASRNFKKPAFFGREVTDEAEFRNASLALHGLPHGSPVKYQIGALPYLFKGGRLHVVLVMNSAQTRWILPKGQPEADMSRQDVAVMEAMEEAGVIGSCDSGLRAQCKLKGEKTLHVYPLLVTTVLKKWPEMTWRKREVVPVARALKMLGDRTLAACVERLADKLEA